jgi:dihydropteroate synthase
VHARLAALLETAQNQGRALVMAVVNVTPDSFYDGGQYTDNERVRERIDQVLKEGADLIDIGAESSRPGAAAVPAEEQLRRLDFGMRHALDEGALVSIDTTDAQVARQCGALGACVINDVSCLRSPDLARAAAEVGAALVITHSRKPMAEMGGYSAWPDNDYEPDVVACVKHDWSSAAERARDAGLATRDLIFDPGFGFSKNARHSYALLGRLREFESLGCRILSGPGRKSFLAHFDGAPAHARLGGTIAASVISVQNGANILRVHDVHATNQALSILYAARNPDLARPSPGSHV